MVFEVLRELVKGTGGGWACVDGVCTSLTATLQCNGHHSRVSVPRLEVQTTIRKGDRRCREEKERRHNTRTQGHKDTWTGAGGGGVTWHASLYVDRFFLSFRIGCDLHDRRRLRACRWRQREEKEGEPKAKEVCDLRKLIRIIFDQPTVLPNLKFFSFVSLPSHWPRPPPYCTRPGRSSTPVLILRTAAGTALCGKVQATCPAACL